MRSRLSRRQRVCGEVDAAQARPSPRGGVGWKERELLAWKTMEPKSKKIMMSGMKHTRIGQHTTLEGQRERRGLGKGRQTGMQALTGGPLTPLPTTNNNHLHLLLLCTYHLALHIQFIIAHRKEEKQLSNPSYNLYLVKCEPTDAPRLIPHPKLLFVLGTQHPSPAELTARSASPDNPHAAAVPPFPCRVCCFSVSCCCCCCP